VRAEYAYFDNDIDDLIVLVLNNPAYATPINVRGARIRGHEVSLQARLARYVRVAGNYTRQDAENRSRVYGGIYDGKQLPGRPRDEVYTRLELTGRPGSLFYEYTHRSRLYLDQANFRRVGSRDVHSVGAAWPVLASLTLSFEARNLTDDQTSDVAGFPLPGRAFYGSITMTMPPAHREDMQ
jgi:iron complex outermembrane receptor protein